MWADISIKHLKSPRKVESLAKTSQVKNLNATLWISSQFHRQRTLTVLKEQSHESHTNGIFVSLRTNVVRYSCKSVIGWSNDNASMIFAKWTKEVLLHKKPYGARICLGYSPLWNKYQSNILIPPHRSSMRWVYLPALRHGHPRIAKKL